MYKPYGIIPPIITPFDEEGKVNYDSLAKMSVYLVENGVHGLFPFGTTGEFYAVSDEEYVKALETVRDAVKGMTNCYGKPIQLMAGCSHITTRGVIRLIHLVEQVGGYDAVSVLTPMFVSQTQDELYQYYKTIAESTKMPVLMYNNKPKTNVTIAPATVARLAKDCPNIIGVKDSTGDMTNCEEYLRLTADQRDHFNVMMGRDTMIHAALAYGCSGAVASCANVAPAWWPISTTSMWPVIWPVLWKHSTGWLPCALPPIWAPSRSHQGEPEPSGHPGGQVSGPHPRAEA